MRNPAALPRLSVPAKIGRAVISAALFGSFGLTLAQDQSGQTVDLAPVRARAEQSEPDAQNALGNAYSSGIGSKQDYAAALTWYRRAAQQGNAPAEFNLGLAYELGRGVTVDERQAFKYYLMAAEQGFGPAQFNIGNMYSAGRGVGQDLFEANLWYRQAAEKGITEAQFNLGLAYEAGRGVKKDEAQAARWYQPAADRGFARAQYNLGLLLEEGRGGAKNEAAAAALYRAAAEQGFASAQNSYGLMIADGRGGLTRDPVQASMWLNLAVQNGATPAARDFITQGLTPDQLTEVGRLVAERAKLARPAATPGEAVAKLDSPTVSSEVPKSALGVPVPGDAGTIPKEQSIAASPAPSSVVTAVAPSGQAEPAKKAAAPGKSLTEKAGNVVVDEALSGAQQKLTRIQLQLDEANQALEKSGASVAELTVENDRLEKALAAAKAAVATSPMIGRDEVAKARVDTTDLATLREERASLREENNRLRQAEAQATAARVKNEQLSRDNEQLTAFMNSNRRDFDQSQLRVAELQKQLDALKSGASPSASATGKEPVNLTDSGGANEKLAATVAELTAANEKLEKDLANARKSVDAALASQSQAVSAAQPEAFKMEISTLQAHVKELESQSEEERNSTAKEIATMAAQLQRTRETNRSLTEANHALLSAKDNNTGAAEEELEQLRGKVRELTAAGEETRRQNQRMTGELQRVAAERETFKAQLDEARKITAIFPGLADEKAALQEKLEIEGAQYLKVQQDLENLRRSTAELTAQLTESRQSAEKAQIELTAQQARVAEAEKVADTHDVSVAELTQANGKLEQEVDTLRHAVESSRAEVVRLTQVARSAEQLRVDADRSGQQNIDALTSQLVQLRRELESSRVAQSRSLDAAAAQERERAAVISQLRQENSALVARLTQAQGTLDQIAATARLGTPAAVIASGGPAPVRPVSTVGSVESAFRTHTVVEGDSLSRISLRYYGTPNRWQDVFQANREVLQGSNALRVGMQLRIP